MKSAIRHNPAPHQLSPSAHPDDNGTASEPAPNGAPRLPRTYVPRRRLWRALDRGVEGSLTLLVAPAGAGKTLGVGGWLAQPCGADHGRASALWIQADRGWSPEQLGALLDDSGPDRLVVVDDAHLLSSATLRVMDERLSAAPQTMRLLLLSRWDLPLSRMVPELLGHFTSVRGDVLRLDEAESTALISTHSRSSAPEVIAAITKQAQGWCAAVVLTSRVVATSPDPVEAARRYTRADARVADRIASEVFAALRPRERHLLLCTANEEVVTAETAIHLTHDPLAGEVLTDLETTGLLVTRLGPTCPSAGTAQTDPDVGSDDPRAVRFRIHPLLAEVVRRRVVTGGVDVARAQATVLRAVRLDVQRGDTSRAFNRLVGLNQPDEASDLLATDGHTLLMRGEFAAIQGFGRHFPHIVEAHPRTWFFFAMERWFAGDIDAAMHWIDRLVDLSLTDTEAGPDAVPDPTQLSCVRLMRAQLGLESLAAAAKSAQSLVDAELDRATPRAELTHLLAELGISQTWLGDLPAAEANLAHAVRLSNAWQLPAYAVSAMTHLATVLFLQGREDAARSLATEALEIIDRRLPWRPKFSAYRAQLVLELTDLSTLPWATAATQRPDRPRDVHAADLTAAFWTRLVDARWALVDGSVIAAERLVQIPFDAPRLPEHLRAVVTIERSFLAALAEDRQALGSMIQTLGELGLTGEADLVRGLLADLNGDRHAAADHLRAAAATVSVTQPPCQSLALTCEAQLRDAIGERDAALQSLRTAITSTEVRRNAVPFLGWSRQGTSLHLLLDRLHELSSEPWLAELRTATAAQPGIVAALAPWTPTVHERVTTSDTTFLPALTPREREVLHELARGATYADIAVTLFVSENTVKTHVSSLYSKLNVSRRSEALAVARSLNLQ